MTNLHHKIFPKFACDKQSYLFLKIFQKISSPTNTSPPSFSKINHSQLRVKLLILRAIHAIVHNRPLYIYTYIYINTSLSIFLLNLSLSLPSLSLSHSQQLTIGKHLEIPHVTRPSSHSFLPEFLLIVVWFQLNYNRVKGESSQGMADGGGGGGGGFIRPWLKRQAHGLFHGRCNSQASWGGREESVREREKERSKGRKHARTQATVIATVFIIVAHSSALCADPLFNLPPL